MPKRSKPIPDRVHQDAAEDVLSDDELKALGQALGVKTVLDVAADLGISRTEAERLIDAERAAFERGNSITHGHGWLVRKSYGKWRFRRPGEAKGYYDPLNEIHEQELRFITELNKALRTCRAQLNSKAGIKALKGKKTSKESEVIAAFNESRLHVRDRAAYIAKKLGIPVRTVRHILKNR